jgi:hypothetical protein
MSGNTTQVEKMRQSVKRRFDSSTAGTWILTSIFVLSGILSAIFFWRHSAAVFSGLPIALSTALGLAIGLVPSELAFFGWKRIRATKVDLTKNQLKASEGGMWAAIGFAVTNVIAIFVSSFSGVPAAIQQVTVWITFFALMIPIPAQLLLYSWFVVNEQSVVENHANAKLAALAHAAFIRGEEARIGAVLQGIDDELERTLAGYGASTGSAEAGRILRDGKQDIVGQFYNQPPRTVPNEPPPLLPQMSADELNRLLALARSLDVSNSTHIPTAHERDDNGKPRPPIGGGGDGPRPM